MQQLDVALHRLFNTDLDLDTLYTDLDMDILTLILDILTLTWIYWPWPWIYWPWPGYTDLDPGYTELDLLTWIYWPWPGYTDLDLDILTLTSSGPLSSSLYSGCPSKRRFVDSDMWILKAAVRGNTLHSGHHSQKYWLCKYKVLIM